jgi:SAM-dependent methyltransferase
MADGHTYSLGDLSSITSRSEWRAFIRKLEIELIFVGFSEGHFDRGLELGCGSGANSRYLARYCKSLVALEYDESKLRTPDDTAITFITGDAQHLSQFEEAEMDLVFSSNLLEHLPDLARCLAECKRIVKKGGLVVHTVPNRTWKIFNVLLYYPFCVRTAFRLVFRSDHREGDTNGNEGAKPKLDNNLKPVDRSLLSLKRLSPRVHGISRTHWAEFIRWGRKRWIASFEQSGFEVVDIIRLPFYLGYGYTFRSLLSLGNRIGLSSSTAFVMRRK